MCGGGCGRCVDVLGKLKYICTIHLIMPYNVCKYFFVGPVQHVSREH